jgi:hypothetical protein
MLLVAVQNIASLRAHDKGAKHAALAQKMFVFVSREEFGAEVAKLPLLSNFFCVGTVGMNHTSNRGFKFQITEGTADVVHVELFVSSLVHRKAFFSLQIEITQRALVPCSLDQIVMLFVRVLRAEERFKELSGTELAIFFRARIAGNFVFRMTGTFVAVEDMAVGQVEIAFRALEPGLRNFFEVFFLCMPPTAPTSEKHF